MFTSGGLGLLQILFCMGDSGFHLLASYIVLSTLSNEFYCSFVEIRRRTLIIISNKLEKSDAKKYKREYLQERYIYVYEDATPVDLKIRVVLDWIDTTFDGSKS